MLKRQPQDFAIESDKLNGIYRGVIEDNNDPLKMGRCRIRVWGIHTEKKVKDEFEGIPTDELPWAEPALSLFEGSISGFGAWTVPLQGSHVFLFFEGGHILRPIYFASVPGIPKNKADKTKGFNDPNGTFPWESRLEESDFSRLSRAEKTSETLVQFKNDNVDTGVSMSNGSTWDEPNSAYGAEYPHNISFVTHGGITIELDSTNGKKRVHVYHPSNSYIEIDNDGNMVIRNNKKRYEVVMDDNNIHIKGSGNITIEGDETRYIKGNQFTKVDENLQEDVIGQVITTIGQNETKNVGMNETDIIGMNLTKTVAVNETNTIGANKTDVIGANKTETVGALATHVAGGIYSITAPLIKLN